MTRSIWRYSHLILALASATFLLVASLTGIILAFEPISDKVQPFKKADLDRVTLAETISKLRKTYEEVLDLEVDVNDFVIASVLTTKGISERIYIDPNTGEPLGDIKEKAAFFQWTTNLHRSLFLKSIGRFFVGLVSFLLCLITLTGFFLLAKRQGGFRKVFSKIQNEYFEQRYHVIVGRWLLVPILIVAVTGVYLSADTFSLLPEAALRHESKLPLDTALPEKNLKETPVLKQLRLGEVRSVLFPFSDAPEDYFEIALNDRELYVHQYTGEILSEAEYPFVTLAKRFSLTLHTGQGSIVWSLVLLASSSSLLFFMYSGFVISLKRRRKIRVVGPPQNKDRCAYIILVGSETGSTNDFAILFQNALTKVGKKVYRSTLNAYTTYESAEHMIIFTATYGAGDAPTNARNFQKHLSKINPIRDLTYSVVGFGSRTYHDYCAFAVEVDSSLQGHASFKALLPLHKINDQSFEAFSNWTTQWSQASGESLKIETTHHYRKPIKTAKFKIVQKTETTPDDNFIMRLRPTKKVAFQSGDLLAYRPKKDGTPRLYSIARIGKDMLLCIKRHEFGLASTQLSGLAEQGFLTASIQRNHEFHFPESAQEIVCISNGTGIAPFLGIIDENKKRIPIHLLWGGRTEASFKPYKEIIADLTQAKKLTSFDLAFSQEYEQKVYVQDLLRKSQERIAQQLATGTIFMICGSMAMQNEVLAVLDTIATTTLKTTLDEFEHKGQLKTDCY